jgi:DNA-directed RNA polymerase specialized sigma subunit
MGIEKDFLKKEVFVDNLDNKLYKEWKNDPTKDNFQRLYRHFTPILRSAIRKASYSSALPNAAFKLQAANEFYNSLKRYDPNQGAKLHSFIYGNVEKKVKRLNYNYSEITRTPERSGGNLGAYHIGPFRNAKILLEEKLGREPSSMELADYMKVPLSQVTRLENEDRRDLSLNEELEDLVTFKDVSTEQAELAMVYHDLSPRQQLIFDYASGAHGKPALKKPSGKVDWIAVARQVGISDQQLKRERDKIVKQMEK